MGGVRARVWAAVTVVGAAVLATGAIVVAGGAPALADSTSSITDCTSSAVEAAVTAGGSYVFDCGGPIQVPAMTVTTDVSFTTDGSHSVTLSGSASRIFDVESGTLTLSGIGLSGAATTTSAAGAGAAGLNGSDGTAGTPGVLGTKAAPTGTDGGPGGPGNNGSEGDTGATVTTVAQGGGIYVAAGAAVSLNHVTLTSMSATGGQGGSGGQGGWGGEGGTGGSPGGNCCSAAGDSVRSGGAGGNGGNGAAGGNGGAGGPAEGGAIYVAPGGTLTASSTTFTDDEATGGAGGAAGSGGDGGDGGNAGPSAVPPYRGGGAAGNGGNAGLPGSGGSAEGGALYNAGTATLLNVAFTSDSAVAGAGGSSAYFGFTGTPVKGGERPPAQANAGLPGRAGEGSLGPTDCSPATGPPALGVCRGLGGAGGSSGNGAVGGAGGAAQGGALYNAGSLRWTGGIVTQNSATGGSGGSAGVTYTGTAGGDDGSGTPEGPNGSGGTTGTGGQGGTANGGAVWPDAVVAATSAPSAGPSTAAGAPGATPISASQILGTGNTVTGGTGGPAGQTYDSASGNPVSSGKAGSAGAASVGDPSFLGSPEPAVSSIDPVQGPLGGGNTVVIHGSGFEHPALTLAGVYFRPNGDTSDKGLAAVSPVVVSDTEIDVVAPDAGSAATNGKVHTTVDVEFTNSTLWPTALDIVAGVASGGSNAYLFALDAGCQITATPTVQKLGQSVRVAWMSDATYLGDVAYLSDADPTATPSGQYEQVADTAAINPSFSTATTFTYWFSLYPKAMAFGAPSPACTTKVTVTWTDAAITPSVTADTVAVAYGAAADLTGTVTGPSVTPTGTVTATLGGAPIGTATLSATGAFSVHIPAGYATAGTRTITVSYSGDDAYATGSGSATYAVTAATPAAITLNGGRTITATRTVRTAVPVTVSFASGVAPDVSSAVQLKKGATVLATATVSSAGTGTATIPANKLSAGANQAITATYVAVAGKTAARTVNDKITVDKVAAKLTASPTSRTVRFGAATTVRITVTSAAGAGDAPTGTVTITDGRKTLATGALKRGKVTLKLRAKVLGRGRYTLTLTYRGDGNTAARTASFTYVVTG